MKILVSDHLYVAFLITNAIYTRVVSDCQQVEIISIYATITVTANLPTAGDINMIS